MVCRECSIETSENFVWKLATSGMHANIREGHQNIPVEYSDVSVEHGHILEEHGNTPYEYAGGRCEHSYERCENSGGTLLIFQEHGHIPVKHVDIPGGHDHIPD